jgi:Protein of unknown function (DUF2971)
MTESLFKYTTANTALAILKNKTLRWSSPDSFNDPFEFKNPFALGFEWKELEEPFLKRISTILTQDDDPVFIEGNPVTPIMRLARTQHARSDPDKIRAVIKPNFLGLVKQWAKIAEEDQKTWTQMKEKYRVLCFSSNPAQILMWSHYADHHRGVVFSFQPKITFGNDLLTARPVDYSKDVPVAGTIEEYLGYITGERSKPDTSKAFEKSVYTKSSDWAYENEWRILGKARDDEEGPFSDREFYPEELVAIYFGCRMPRVSREDILNAVSGWGSPISFFQMRDERIRFELTAEPLNAEKPEAT